MNALCLLAILSLNAPMVEKGEITFRPALLNLRFPSGFNWSQRFLAMSWNR